MKPYPEELWGTFEGTEYENMRRTAAMTFHERLLILDEMRRFVHEVREANRPRQSEPHGEESA